MVTYQQFTSFSQAQVTQTDFPYIEARAVDLLSQLCGDSWSETDATCIKAVEYQIEHILNLGGLAGWLTQGGSVGSRSYSVGGESESVTFVQGSQGRSFLGLSVSPVAWMSLQHGGFIQTVRGVRPCY